MTQIAGSACGGFDVNANLGALGKVQSCICTKVNAPNDFEEAEITLPLVRPYSILTKCLTGLGIVFFRIRILLFGFPRGDHRS